MNLDFAPSHLATLVAEGRRREYIEAWFFALREAGFRAQPAYRMAVNFWRSA